MRILTGAVIGATLAFALGWWFLKTNPTAPIITAPTGAVLEAQATTTKVLLEWEHGGTLGHNGGNPKKATHFIVCLYPSFSGQVCKFPNGIGVDPAFRHVAALPDFDRTALSNVPGIFGGNDPYAYEFEADLPESLYDQNLTWAVGACAGQSIGACTFSNSARIELTARNIHNVDVSDNVSTANKRVDFDIEIGNTGHVATGDFRLTTSVYEILVDISGMPLTDVNSIGSAANWEGGSLALDDVVIMKDGNTQSVFLLDLVAEGQRDSSEVWAIARPGSSAVFWSTDIPSIAVGPGALEYKPCTRSQRVQGLCQVTVGHSNLPTGFAVVSIADPHGMITEFNEDDNRAMANNIVMHPGP